MRERDEEACSRLRFSMVGRAAATSPKTHAAASFAVGLFRDAMAVRRLATRLRGVGAPRRAPRGVQKGAPDMAAARVGMKSTPTARGRG